MEKKPSLFAQRMKLRREEKLKNQPIRNDNQLNIFGDKSYILSGNEAEEIHTENVRKLSEIPPEQLAEERNKLLSELDPKIIEFIRSKRAKNVPPHALGQSSSSAETDSHSENWTREMDTEPAPTRSENTEAMDTSGAVGQELEVPEVVVEEVKELSKYPHMDVVEKDKFQWMGELPLEVQPPSDPYPARFNFEGELLPYSDKGEGVLQGLHNHGEEPERPGYTLQELIQLSRSSVIQQRVISLNTLAKIMSKAAVYDECFNEPILPALLEADMFLLLRFSLDDPAAPIVMAAASALGNLIVNQIDEACLDTLLGTQLGLQQPSLGVILDMKQSDIDELKDQQLLKLDIIRGALRTDILQRIKYILTELKPEPVEIKQLLKILIRISRHSFEMANNVFTYPGLLEAVRSLLDVSYNSSSFYPEALKVFRIIASRSHSLASVIFNKYDIHKVLFAFIAGDKAFGHPEAMHLVLESFYTWQSFLSYNIGTDTIESLSPVLMRLLETHFGLTNVDGSRLDLEHATALVSTIAVVSKLNFSRVRYILPLLLQATVKWLTQYISAPEDKFAASKLLGTCFSLFASTFTDFDSSSALLPTVEKLILSPCFKNTVLRLKKASWLIHGRIISSPENLPCLGCVSPTVKEESSLPFIHAICVYILASKRSNLMEMFLNKQDLLGYIRAILKGDNMTRLCGHWYARPELYFLVGLTHMFTSVDIREHQNMFHKLAFQLLTSIQMGDKALLPEIVSKSVFNKKYFSLDVDTVSRKLEELRIGSETNAPKTNKNRYSFLDESIKKLPEIETLFIRELGLEGLVIPWPPITLTGLLNSTQSALPLDWPFLPIMRLHERQGSDKNAISIIELSLEWFIILEELLPDVFSLDYTAKYCRLCCVYLAGNDLFQDVSPLLEQALYYINRHKGQLNFEKSIPGLTSFYDFYRELLEQYAGVSYGNTVFGQYVLVPLQQRHNVKYKKIIWSELAAVLRLLRTSVDEVDMRDFLRPCETDSDLLRIYLHAVGTGKVREIWCPVLYNVAVHHVASYVKNNSDAVASSLLSMIKALGNQDLKNQFLNYSYEGTN